MCNGTISQSFNTGKVSSRYTYVANSKLNSGYSMGLNGGIGGYMLSSKVYNSYNTGIVYGNDQVGGIVGAFDRVPGTTVNSYIYNCYNATTSVLGNTNVGNLIGGQTYVTGDYLYWITGTEPLGGIVNNCTYKIYTDYSLDNMKKTTSGLLTNLQSGTYGSSDIWGQDEGGLPYLKNNKP